MSRFGNLELGPEEESRNQSGFSGRMAAKDETWYLTAAQTALEVGDFELALRHYGKVIECQPAHVEGWAGQVKMLIELGQYGEAKLWADKALEHFANEPELLAAKGVALGRLGDLDGALAYSDSAFAEHGESAYLWLARGDVLLSRKEARADFCFQKMGAIDPHHWLWRWLAARVHYFHRQFALGLKWAQEALALDGGKAVIWFQLALCQQELGLATAAKASISQARQLNPHSTSIEHALQEWQSPSLWKRLGGWLRRSP